MNILDALKGLNEVLEESKSESKPVKKVIPMKSDWRKKYDDYTELGKKIEEMINVYESKKKLFWAIIEDETGEYGDMKALPKTSEIRIYEK